MPVKVTIASASPDQWSRPLQSRNVYLDKQNMELIGCDCGVQRVGGSYEIVGSDADSSYLDIAEAKLKAAWDWLFKLHYPAHCHKRRPAGDSDGDGGYDTGTDDYGMPSDMMPPDDGGTAPEGGAASAPSTVVQMAPDAPASMPGPSAPPQFTSPNFSSPVATLASSVTAFKTAVKSGDPAAIQTLHSIAAKAPTSPVHAAVLKAVSSNAAPAALATGKFKPTQTKPQPYAIVNGEVDSVSDAMTSILSAALAPVAWAANGVGTVSKSVGNHLAKASRKL